MGRITKDIEENLIKMNRFFNLICFMAAVAVLVIMFFTLYQCAKSPALVKEIYRPLDIEGEVFDVMEH